ncbi:hypothetical protein Gohar_025392, partial [Gossypium harknessii]|nr:hypothetical protein [Gossypium harknessii]
MVCYKLLVVLFVGAFVICSSTSSSARMLTGGFEDEKTLFHLRPRFGGGLGGGAGFGGGAGAGSA